MTTKQETALAKADAAALAMMGEYAGAGLEHADSETMAIPFLRVLQKSSPQCDEAMSEFNEAARPGMLLDTVTGDLMSGKEGITILPCAFERQFLIFAARGNGGFKGEIAIEDVADKEQAGEIVRHEGRMLMNPSNPPNPKTDDSVSDTRLHYCLILHPTGPRRALLSLTSTQIKKSKQLLSMLAGAKVAGRTPPTWMNRIKLTTIPEQNDFGSWHGVKFEADGFIDSPDLFTEGVEFHKLVTSGEANVDVPSADEGGTPTDDGKF